MTIYESNFLKLERLIGTILPTESGWVSRVADDCDLHLEILRRETYTTTLKLTYYFEEEREGADTSSVEHCSALVADPDLTLRVYHDAALVEAVTGRRHRHHHHLLKALAESHAGELDRRWRINIMLNKWLDYLLDNGHSFG